MIWPKELHDKNNIYLTTDEAQKIPPVSGTYKLLRDHYWLTAQGDILIFKGLHPMCNFNKALVEKVYLSKYPELSMIFLPIVFFKDNNKY